MYKSDVMSRRILASEIIKSLARKLNYREIRTFSYTNFLGRN